MKIDESLNLVLPLNDSVMVYHAPISRAVFEANYRALAFTKAELMSKGVSYQISAGPRIAAMLFIDEARKNDEEGAARAFLAELRRLSMVLLASPSGWDMVPVDAAINTGKVDEEEWQEVESELVFFTCHCALAKKSERAQIAAASASLMQGYTTSLPCSEFVGSLRRSTKEEPMQTSAASSVPR